MTYLSNNDKSSDFITITDIWCFFSKNSRLILCGTFIGLFLGFLLSFLGQSSYQTDVILEIPDSKININHNPDKLNTYLGGALSQISLTGPFANEILRILNTDNQSIIQKLSETLNSPHDAINNVLAGHITSETAPSVRGSRRKNSDFFILIESLGVTRFRVSVAMPQPLLSQPIAIATAESLPALFNNYNEKESKARALSSKSTSRAIPSQLIKHYDIVQELYKEIKSFSNELEFITPKPPPPILDNLIPNSAAINQSLLLYQIKEHLILTKKIVSLEKYTLLSKRLENIIANWRMICASPLGEMPRFNPSIGIYRDAPPIDPTYYALPSISSAATTGIITKFIDHRSSNRFLFSIVGLIIGFTLFFLISLINTLLRSSYIDKENC